MGATNSGLPDFSGRSGKRREPVRQSELSAGLRRDMCVRSSRQQTWNVIESRREPTEVDDTEIDGVNF